MAKKRTAAKPPDLRLHAATVVPIAELKPHPRNYKKHPAKQLAHLEASLKKYGQFRNVVLAEDGTILAGHGVTEAAARLGWTNLTCIRLPISPNSPEALKILALDNELPKFAETDDGALVRLLREVAGSDLDGLLGSGFDVVPGDAAPPTEFPEFDENIPTEHACPKCGYKFSGAPKRAPGSP